MLLVFFGLKPAIPSVYICLIFWVLIPNRIYINHTVTETNQIFNYANCLNIMLLLIQYLVRIMLLARMVGINLRRLSTFSEISFQLGLSFIVIYRCIIPMLLIRTTRNMNRTLPDLLIRIGLQVKRDAVHLLSGEVIGLREQIRLRGLFLDKNISFFDFLFLSFPVLNE